jgi:DNA-binding transcriptional ArsR family regulator
VASRGNPTIQCKICRSGAREQIDELLLKGVSYGDIVRLLKNNHGITLERASVSRHARNHTEGFVENVRKEGTIDKLSLEGVFSAIDLSSCDEEVGVDEAMPLQEKTNQYLSAIFQKTLQFLWYGMKEFEAGRASFPVKEIKAMQDLFKILQTLGDARSKGRDLIAIEYLLGLSKKVPEMNKYGKLSEMTTDQILELMEEGHP